MTMERVIGAILALFIGSILGSFINVLVFRLREASTLWGRSECRSCHKIIKPRHLVPVLSWLLLRGKCASCHAKIHWQYPVVEAAGALLVLAAFLRHDFFLPAHIAPFIFESLFALNLLLLATFDWRWKLLPIEWMMVSVAVFGIAAVVLGLLSPLFVVLGALVGFAFLGLQVLVSGGKWLGSGDPWLGAFIGAALGWPAIVFVYYFAYIGGACILLPFLFLNKVNRKTQIPFGPLLAFGALMTVWFGQGLLAWLTRIW